MANRGRHFRGERGAGVQPDVRHAALSTPATAPPPPPLPSLPLARRGTVAERSRNSPPWAGRRLSFAVTALTPLEHLVVPATDSAGATRITPALDARQRGVEAATAGRLALTSHQTVWAGEVAATATSATTTARLVGASSGVAAALLLVGVFGGGGTWRRMARRVALACRGAASRASCPLNGLPTPEVDFVVLWGRIQAAAPSTDAAAETAVDVDGGLVQRGMVALGTVDGEHDAPPRCF